MFDSDDYLNSLFSNDYSTTTVADTETEQQTSYGPQTQVNTFEKDDYSSTQNYTEQQTYESLNSNKFNETETKATYSKINMPLIQKSEPTVKLVKSRARVRLETRMKIVLSVFSVIVACLLFVSVFNFIKANKIQATFYDKQQQINALEQSIKVSQTTYTLVTDEEYIKNWADSEGYKEKKEGENLYKISIDKIYEEEIIQEVPSNWFNDVCEFFSKLFA